MPRKAREKSPEAIYHIMCRSIPEVLMFRDDDDKNYYIGLLKRYSEQFKCSIYAYCAMDNHLHFQIDPKGFDISKFMQCINTSYVSYYNNKYVREGSVFQGRFQSRILDTEEYNLTVSAYIHNNPHDIEGFSGKEEQYKYSSYGIYLGIREDYNKLIDKSFVMGLFNTYDEERFAERYLSFVSHQRDIGSFKELKKKLSNGIEYEYISGRKVILRDLLPSKVVSYISSKLMGVEIKDKIVRLNRKLLEFRAVTAYALRALCGLGYKEICSNIYNITISGCSKLCSRGYELINGKDSIYASLLDELISCET